jgi:hypothetical protein
MEARQTTPEARSNREIVFQILESVVVRLADLRVDRWISSVMMKQDK